MAYDIEIHLCGPGDETLFRYIADDVFDDPVTPAKLAHYLALPNHHLFIVIDQGVVVGQLTALLYEHPENRPSDLFIDEVGVAASARRSGVATQLMQAAFTFGRERGCREAWLGTAVDNQEARAFYESLGQQGSPVIYFTFRL